MKTIYKYEMSLTGTGINMPRGAELVHVGVCPRGNTCIRAPEYTPQYYIDKFVKTRSKEWGVGAYIDNDGHCCALGHCGRRNGSNTREATALWCVFKRAANGGILSVSDGGSESVKLRKSGKVISLSPNLGPRGRVLKVLRAIVKEKA